MFESRWHLFYRPFVVVGVVSALLAASVPAFATLPDSSTPTLGLDRTIRTRPFVNSAVKMSDGEGSAYVPSDGSLWISSDSSRTLYELDPATGGLRRTITRTAFENAPLLGGGPLAGIYRTHDLESLAYDAQDDVLYAFSGKCCTVDTLPTVFRLKRDADGRFQVESYQPLPSGTDYTAAAWNPIDGKIYVGVGGAIRTYDYITNVSSTRIQIANLTGIFGMSFADTPQGVDLFVARKDAFLSRVDWDTRSLVPGWTFDLKPFGMLDSRAVELIGDQFFIPDGAKRSDTDPLKYAVFVFNVLG